MSDADRERWDARYQAGKDAAHSRPSPFLVEWLPALPRGRALDVACGRGRNAIFLAERGYRVDAIDISPIALALARRRAHGCGVNIEWRCEDLDLAPIAPARYDLIVVSRYLNRKRIPELKHALRTGGAVLYEQHMVSQEKVGGPKSERFRLQPNELLDLFRDLRIVFYHESIVREPDRAPLALARLIATGRTPRT